MHRTAFTCIDDPRARTTRLPALLLGVLALAAPALAHADWVASEQEERAQRTKIAKGYPADAARAVAPYPGAKLDVQCSVNRWGGDADSYAFVTNDPMDKVREFYRANPVDATRGRVYVTQDGCDGGSHVTVVLDLYPAAKVEKLRAAAALRKAEIDRLAASPPDPAQLGQPLPADATFDAECTVDADRSKKSDFERVACYRVAAPTYDAAYEQLRKLEVYAGRWDNNVIVSIRNEPMPVRLHYQIGKGGPTKSLAEKQAAASAPSARTASAPSSSSSSTTAADAAAPAAKPAPATPNPADKAKDAVNKLKGLFGR